MGDSVLVLLIGGVAILIWGMSSLLSGEVYWGRVFRFSGRKLITKGRVPSLIHGIPLTAAGILGLLAGLLAAFAPASDLIELLTKVYIILILVGVVGSFLSTAFGFAYSAEEIDPADLEDAAREQYGDKYGRW